MKVNGKGDHGQCDMLKKVHPSPKCITFASFPDEIPGKHKSKFGEVLYNFNITSHTHFLFETRKRKSSRNGCDNNSQNQTKRHVWVYTARCLFAQSVPCTCILIRPTKQNGWDWTFSHKMTQKTPKLWLRLFLSSIPFLSRALERD